jgi:diaminohydroxyphosphoribosylaminopyrimidine deaminase/5-amino-6-(5-phosphoribosylamino)uracil reductase
MSEGSDARFMAAALAFGRRHLGETGTNPAVGAIIVREGVAVGHGATQPGGRPHAETQALAQAGASARGATMYVTLEPCSHHGRTPPCADAITAAGIARVVSAMTDPNPQVAGQGHARLSAAGVEVSVGLGARAAARAHRGHVLRVTEGRPMVCLKIAETADGYAADDPQDQRLRITGPEADARVHMLRSVHDAILVGAGTIRVDDPLLTVRLPGLERRRPLRVVLDPAATLSPSSRIAATAADWPTLVFVNERASAAAVALLEERGIGIDRSTGRGPLDLRAVLERLAAHARSRVFCEGGPTLASALLAQGLVDEAVVFRAPKPLGRRGLSSLTAEARARLESMTLYDSGSAGRDRWRAWEKVA